MINQKSWDEVPADVIEDCNLLLEKLFKGEAVPCMAFSEVEFGYFIGICRSINDDVEEIIGPVQLGRIGILGALNHLVFHKIGLSMFVDLDKDSSPWLGYFDDNRPWSFEDHVLEEIKEDLLNNDFSLEVFDV